MNTLHIPSVERLLSVISSLSKNLDREDAQWVFPGILSPSAPLRITGKDAKGTCLNRKSLPWQTTSAL